MTTCDGCKFAQWRLRTDGKLHPDKSGKCTWDGLDTRLPTAFYWASFSGKAPIPSGGYIERGLEHKVRCVFKQASIT